MIFLIKQLAYFICLIKKVTFLRLKVKGMKALFLCSFGKTSLLQKYLLSSMYYIENADKIERIVSVAVTS